MTFDVLTAKGADAARWTSLVDRLPVYQRDVHFLPEYGRIYEDTHGFESLLAIYESSDCFVIQPFVRRPLVDLPFLQAHDDRFAFSDITNPYGFGGPIASDAESCKAAFPEFSKAFGRWCDERHVASEFTCLHPFLERWQRPLIAIAESPHHEKDVVFIDLTQGEAELIAGLRKGHRSSIARARRSNVEVRSVDPLGAEMDLFREMYIETMQRRSAAARWSLPDVFFKATVRHLGADRTSLLIATVEGVPESGCLLMHGYDTAYYHFAATFAKHPGLGVNNLMVFEAAKLMKAAGKRRLHLGGGVSSNPDDSLFLFKAGFSPGRAPLYTYFAVRDIKAYDELCERKRAHERQADGEESMSDFLPLYRR